LAVEEGGDGHFIAAKESAQAGESQIGGAFGFKESGSQERDLGKQSRLFRVN
jgi:hypothetical protein